MGEIGEGACGSRQRHDPERRALARSEGEWSGSSFFRESFVLDQTLKGALNTVFSIE